MCRNVSLTGRLKHYVYRSSEGEPYMCGNCGAEFDIQYHVCPECGGFGVERQHWEFIE
ncbi:Uncharacterized protein AArcS_1636 [Natranaeroarchaeum sulfidigenes]|uniref:Uncharacterized protein n=1 Tax=Natranaeroarchaeum sulfidigenes TaxID=2784880 RepID=A0A897MXG1_9EURY|nr:Uncharacterized protein AArcS_1636 [Natranaeroarchaeum sulfidigenes]